MEAVGGDENCLYPRGWGLDEAHHHVAEKELLVPAGMGGAEQAEQYVSDVFMWILR